MTTTGLFDGLTRPIDEAIVGALNDDHVEGGHRRLPRIPCPPCMGQILAEQDHRIELIADPETSEDDVAHARSRALWSDGVAEGAGPLGFRWATTDGYDHVAQRLSGQIFDRYKQAAG